MLIVLKCGKRYADHRHKVETSCVTKRDASERGHGPRHCLKYLWLKVQDVNTNFVSKSLVFLLRHNGVNFARVI